jgi:hypothetical protein
MRAVQQQLPLSRRAEPAAETDRYELQQRDRAPRARVYVVGYPDLLPAAGNACAGTLGITAGDGYIDTYTPSRGHDACAAPASRWIEPLVAVAAAAPLHPNAVGERGIADAIVGAIKAAA